MRSAVLIRSSPFRKKKLGAVYHQRPAPVKRVFRPRAAQPGGRAPRQGAGRPRRSPSARGGKRPRSAPPAPRPARPPSPALHALPSSAPQTSAACGRCRAFDHSPARTGPPRTAMPSPSSAPSASPAGRRRLPQGRARCPTARPAPAAPSACRTEAPPRSRRRPAACKAPTCRTSRSKRVSPRSSPLSDLVFSSVSSVYHVSSRLDKPRRAEYTLYQISYDRGACAAG